MNEMLAAKPPAQVEPEPLRLVCAEIWGGNRPAQIPVQLPGIRGTLYSRPCHGGRGGDVHYLSVCGSGLLSRMCVADVVGHGEAVSRISGVMHGHLRRAMNTIDQRRVLSTLNVELEAMGLDAMTTAAAITYYAPSRQLSVSYAGHPPAWLYRKSTRQWERLLLDESDEPFVDVALAVDPSARYTRKAIKVAIGDRLVVLTDGVLEAPSAAGEQFGDDRVATLLGKHREADCPAITEALLAALESHVGGRLDHDDVTFLAVEFVPAPRGPSIWHALKTRILRPRGNSESAAFAEQGAPSA